MSWLYSQALVEEYLAVTCLDGEPYAQSSGNLTPQAYCAPDKMKAFSRLSQYGMTYKPLMESHGKELLTWYLEASHARISQSQGGGAASKPNEAACGVKWHASFVKYDPDTSSWKTHQCSLLGGLDEFLETWPKWGLMRDGECWEQLTLERHIRGIGFGLSPNGLDTFHTPNTTGLDGGSNSRKALKKRQEKWPTPVCQDSRHAISRHLDPNNTYWKSNLGEVVMSLEPTQNGRLNPTWVEWLMGWPQEWTDLKPLGMDKYQEWLQQHGES